MKRLAVFLPRPNAYYVSLFFGLKRGFEAHGVEVAGGCQHLQGGALREFVRQFRPDVFFELNRCRDQLEDLPREVRHVAWMLDNVGQENTTFSGSDVVYYSGRPDLESHRAFRARGGKPYELVGLLPPGIDPTRFRPKQVPQCWDFSFAGHIPKPWTAEELDRVITERPRLVRFRDLVETCEAEWSRAHPYRLYLDAAMERVAELAGGSVPLPPNPLRYDLGGRMARLANRRRVLRLVEPLSRSIAIFGPEHWADHAEYAPYYQRNIEDTRELCTVYQETRLNLHNGGGMHFRTFECMASAAVLFYQVGAGTTLEDGVDELFEPFVHYVPFDDANAAEVAPRYLRDEAARRAIGERASALVHAEHTWERRAARILADLAKV